MENNRIKQLETMLSIVFGLAVFFWLTHNRYLPPAILLISAIGLFSKYLTRKIHWFWMKLSHIMGAIMSRVLLSVVFFVFLFPIALLSRLFGKKDPLQLKRTQGNTYYSERNHQYTAEDLENPW